MSYQFWDSNEIKILIDIVMSECCTFVEIGDIREASELCLDLTSFLKGFDMCMSGDAEGQ